MNTPPAIGLQHKIADLCSRSPDPRVANFGAALRSGGSLEAAGLAYVTARFAADNARARRSVLLRQLAARHFAAETKRGRPRSILSALTEFGERQYQQHALNPHAEETLDWLLWELCSIQLQLPEPAPSVRTIRQIIAGGEMVFSHKDGTISGGV